MERRGRLRGDVAALIGSSNGVGWPIDIQVTAVKPGLSQDNVVLGVKAEDVHVDGSMDDVAAGAVKTGDCGVVGGRAAVRLAAVGLGRGIWTWWWLSDGGSCHQ